MLSPSNPRGRGWTVGWTVGWAIAGLSVFDIAAAAIISALPVANASGVHLITQDRNAGVAAWLGILALTLPVAWRRPLPLVAAGAMAAGAVVNVLVFGSLIRYGPALAAAFLVAFGIGAACGRWRAAVGLLLLATDVAVEGYYDPKIGGAGLIDVVPALFAFFAVGWLLRQRDQAARTLRARSAELRRRRAETARLAVLADRAQPSADIEGTSHARLGALAATGLEPDVGDQEAASRVLAVIEQDGRAALSQLNEAAGALRSPAPGEPQPDLAWLPELLARGTTARTRLTVEGQPRPLPAGLELSGYRIVEYLVQAFEDAPDASVDVRLCFHPEALELHVQGTASSAADLRAVLAAARQCALPHGGTVHSQLVDGTCHAVARLPLISGYA